MNKIILPGVILMICSATAHVMAEPKVAITSVMVIKTVDQNQVSDKIIEKIESWGGYFVQRQESSLILKLPRGHMKEFVTFAKSEWGILQHEYNTLDLSTNLNDLHASLTAKKELLEQYLILVDTANGENVLSVEREMSDLISQIETLEGRLRLMQHQLGFASVSIHYQFKSRETPKTDGKSSFPWLNKVNLTDLLMDFQ